MKKLMVMIFMVISFGLTSVATAGNTVVFTNPKVGGVALDWCKTWAVGCGKPAADYFCKVKGYNRAVYFQKEADIGYTRILKTNQICNSPGCDSFKFIRCKKSGYKRFIRPKYHGVALDWCYTWNNRCGKKAANEFCRWRGYHKGASGFKKENNIGYTKIMRTGQICNMPGCDSFLYIDCKK